MKTELKARSTAPVDQEPTRPLGRYHRTPAVVAAELIAVVGLAVTAYIHLEELSGKFAEVPYLGVGYALLSIACVVSIVLIAARKKVGWYVGGATALATFVGFVLTRTVGLPASTDDIGNWSETIGTWSLVAEGTVIAATAAMVALHLRRQDCRNHNADDTERDDLPFGHGRPASTLG